MSFKPKSFKEEHPLGTLFRTEQTRNLTHNFTRKPALKHAEKRQAESNRIREKYPDRIPVRSS